MGNKPAPTITLAEEAYIRLRQEILICTLLPGEIITENKLANRYEMSKTPIREALTQVCRERLVQRLPGRGYMVAPITISEIHDLFDLRLIIETAVVDRVVENSTPEQIAKLREITTVSYSLDDPKSQVQFLEANCRFHLILAEPSGNIRLLRTLESLMIDMDRLFHLGLRLRDSDQEMTKGHNEVVDALESGDVEALRRLIISHISASKDRIMKAIMSGELQPIQVM